MRDIIFRGKVDDENKKWVEGSLLKVEHIIHGEKYYIADLLGNSVRVLPNTIGQYTGLTDKNGTKIFEGDIIVKEDKYCKMYGVISFGEHSPTTAELGEIGFFIEWLDNNSNLWSKWIRNDLGFWVDRGIEVIGNIYENKDLLEESE